MSATTMSAADAVKSNQASGAGASKQQVKSTSSGKALDGARKQAASPVDALKGKQQPPPPPPLKAWQGPNPINQRASTHTPNGTEKPLPKIPSQPQIKSPTETNADKHAHDRALFLLASFTGHDATVTLNNGEQYTGVFSGGSFEPNSKHQYTLKMVRRTRLPTQQQVNGNTDMSDEYIGEGEDHMMAFDKDDTVDLAVHDVVTANAQPLQNGSISSSFRTDTEISGQDLSMPRQRELQRWDAGADSSIDMSLEASGDTSWDQFATNERMYGVQSTYDENIYTTSIDRSDPSYKQKEAKAAQLAREIEGTAPATAHVAEERRRDAERADGLDEEEKYSGVQREAVNLPKRSAGAYVPPSQRPLTNAPTVPGALFDPAIISSQIARPAVPTTAEEAVEVTRSVGPETAVPLEQDGAAAMKSPPQSTQVPSASVEATAEDHVRNAAAAFKVFANDQKLRTRHAAQANAEAKRSTAKAERSVKVNDLKKFAENFKLKSRVPDDLVPILAKDPHKQHEIQHKAEEAWKLEETRSKEEKEKSVATASPTPSASSQIAPTPPTDRGIPFSQPQSTRARVSHNLRSQPQHHSPGKNIAPGMMTGNRGYPRPIPTVQPLPAGMHIPTGPSVPQDAGALSPTTRLNAGAKAFEFRPAANSFTPSGTSPSPQRTTSSSMNRSNVSETAKFFNNDNKPVDPKERKDLDTAFNPIKRLIEADYTEDQKKAYAANGGIPQPYRTPPTWPYSDTNANVSYKDFYAKSQVPSSGPSPMHTPNPNAQMPHAHQLPQHLQAAPHMTPSQRPHYMAPPQQPGMPPQGFDPRMQQFGPNGSVQSSPRFPPAQMAFNGQMQGMQMPQFAGQQMQGYGMSPSMQYRQMNMPPNGPMMMMPNQQHGQIPQMPPGYQRGGPPQGYPPQMMGGAPMMNQHSTGGYMNGPMPQNQSYSPMPPPSQPHMPHMQQGGYTASPRPHMMQHSGSHQGYQPGMLQHQQQQQQFAPSPGHHHHPPYGMGQRQMSAGAGGFPPHMTPRQHHPVPNHPSPGQMGMAGPQQQGGGDEGK